MSEAAIQHFGHQLGTKEQVEELAVDWLIGPFRVTMVDAAHRVRLGLPIFRRSCAVTCR
ncbi:MAG TPA: hypothetical protein VFM19_08370 [Candidatus Limnocylindria bacterium]|nr:hypothetical protein [Candidatus Limnocylindria bacterium]